MPFTQEIADWVASVPREWTAAAVDAAERSLADTMACLVAGAHDEAVSAVMAPALLALAEAVNMVHYTRGWHTMLTLGAPSAAGQPESVLASYPSWRNASVRPSVRAMCTPLRQVQPAGSFR